MTGIYKPKVEYLTTPYERVSKETVLEIKEYPSYSNPARGIRDEIYRSLGYKMKLSEKDGKTLEAAYYPNLKGGKLVGWKKRDFTKPKKDCFSIIGEVDRTCDLVGAWKLKPGKRILIVEGEEDLAAAYQAIKDNIDSNPQWKGKIHPNVVSVTGGAPFAAENLAHNRELLKKYSQVVTAFDNDRATRDEYEKGVRRGYEATCESHLLLGFEKCMYIPLDLKDPSEYIQTGKQKELAELLTWGAKPFTPITMEEGDDISLSELLTANERGAPIPCLPKTSIILSGMRFYEGTLILAPAKCFGRGTHVRMYDGTLKEVSEVVAGDKVMGVDSTPREVEYTHNFEDQTYLVSQSNGESFVASSHHDMVLFANRVVRDTPKGAKRIVPLWKLAKKDWGLKAWNQKKAVYDLAPKDLPLDPYFLGVFLASEGNNDLRALMPRIGDELHRDLMDRKIPDIYYSSATMDRASVLAGTLDVVGSIKGHMMEFSLPKPVAMEVMGLANSLGFRLHAPLKLEGGKQRCFIAGDFKSLPMIGDKPKSEPTLLSEISITPLGVDVVYGFAIKGADKEFLLADGTIVHNSGKTSLVKQVAYDIMIDCIENGHKLGHIFLEETSKKTRQSYLALDTGVSLPRLREDPSILPLEKAEASYRKLFESGVNIFLTTKEGKLSPDQVIDNFKYMYSKGCRYIILDHLSMVISGSNKDNERKEIDNLLTEIAAFCEAHPVHVIVIAHIKRTEFRPKTDDDGEVIYPYWLPVNHTDARGSSAFEQLMWNGVCIEPEIMDGSGTIGRIRTKVVFCREWGTRGVGDHLKWDKELGKLIPAQGD